MYCRSPPFGGMGHSVTEVLLVMNAHTSTNKVKAFEGSRRRPEDLTLLTKPSLKIVGWESKL